jgi:hypothetical protein
MLIKGKLPVQVTSKGLCSSVSHPANNECLAPCEGGLAISCPPPPWSSVPGAGAPGDREGGGVTAGQLPTRMLRQGCPTALIHNNMTMQLSYLTDHLVTTRGTPLQAHLSRSAEILGGNGGGGGRDDPREEVLTGGRGWGTKCASVQVKALASSL